MFCSGLSNLCDLYKLVPKKFVQKHLNIININGIFSCVAALLLKLGFDLLVSVYKYVLLTQIFFEIRLSSLIDKNFSLCEAINVKRNSYQTEYDLRDQQFNSTLVATHPAPQFLKHWMWVDIMNVLNEQMWKQ